MDFLDKRVAVICSELKRLKVRQKFQITSFQYQEGNFIRPEDAERPGAQWRDFDARSMHWYGPDRHYWFRAEYTVPPELDGKRMWIHVSTQIDEWDDGKNPQFLLFVNRKAVQGIDMNHRDVLLAEGAAAGEKYLLDLQSYTGILHEELSLAVYVCEVDAAIEKLYYDLWVPLSALPRMEKEDRCRKEIEEILNRTVNLLDLRTPYSPAFYESLEEAEAYIGKELYTNLAGWQEVVATCIGHTHIDVAWWWTVEQTREKVGRSFATVLKLMDEYPGYRFMSSQPQLYAFLKERYPELYERLKERVAEGRWEPEGGMWVEADCNLTSGESLVRQLLYGKRFFREEFGVDNRILWLPDVFGYSGALPQIMKKCGIDYFMTTKLAWNQFNKIPCDTMRWRGIDGTEILTHLVTTLEVGQAETNFFTTYNGILHPDAIMGGWKRYQNKDINNDILVSFGYGDGGGGPSREMLETSLRMEKGIRGIPRVRQEFAGVYFRELEQRVWDHPRLPVWEGELYFEYHRGTLTSMARNKRANRKAELGLMDLEFLAVLAEEEAPYPGEKLDQLWEKVLLNQFHDILPGSSIREVYEVTREEYAWIERETAALCGERVRALTAASRVGAETSPDGGVPGEREQSREEAGEGITIFNTTGKPRGDVVRLGEIHAEALRDSSGKVYPVQDTKEGGIVYVEGLPAKGFKTFAACGRDGEQSGFLLRDRFTLETPFYLVELDEQGMFSGLYDRENDRQVIQEGRRGNLFRMYEDKPIYYDNWDIDIYYTEKFWDAESLERMEWTELGPVRATLELERRISNSRICQKIRFYRNMRRIDFETWVDWKEHQHLLKVHFPVAVHTDEATFDIQFGNLTRKVHTNTSWDKARFESCGQKWIDLSEGHYGVSLLNDCKYGHSVKDGDIGLTLIKSGIEPNPVSDQEEHVFTYALYPHAEGWRQAQTVGEAYRLNQPAFAAGGGVPGTEYCAVSVNQENIILETVKKAEDGEGIILRMYESENALTKAEVTVNRAFQKAYVCNLLEEVQEEAPVEGNRVRVTCKPYEIVTLRIV